MSKYLFKQKYKEKEKGGSGLIERYLTNKIIIVMYFLVFIFKYCFRDQNYNKEPACKEENIQDEKYSVEHLRLVTGN